MSIAANSSSNHSAENGSSVNHVVNIRPSFLSRLEGTSQELRRLSNLSGEREFCCIFRVPWILLELNETAFHPHMLSIGPFHYGKLQYQMIQEHKWRFLHDLLLRAESRRVVLKDFIEAVAPMEEEIRKSYSETLKFSGPELIEMMVLDGCFIIELFHKVARIVPPSLNDPLFMGGVLPLLMRDLLLLENQIPYFVLQKLFDLSVGSGNDGSSLAKLALGFFNDKVQRPVHVLEKYYDKEGKYLLDLFHRSYIPNCEVEVRRPSRFLHPIQCAKELDQAGIKFKPRKTDSILDVKFRNGVLEIPVLTIDDFWSSLFLNFVAYEQCYRHSSKYITAYATLMWCLITTTADAAFLSDHKIISHFGSDEEVVRFFNNIKMDEFDFHRNYLSKVFEEVNEYYQSSWHVRWAGFKRKCFGSPWSFISGVITLVTLVFATIEFIRTF